VSPETEAEVDLATDKFMADHGAAISDLIRRVGDEALTKLHCLSLWGSPKVALRLRELIRKTVRSNLGGTCRAGTWETDGVFVVAADDLEAPEFRIKVALCLAESRITGGPVGP
jgi:hypothetical protein